MAYIPKSAITTQGARKNWARTATSGRDVESFFSPDCGSTLYWELDFSPDHLGVLIGAFDSPRPTPSRVVWAQEKRPWVQFPDNMECFEQGSPTASG